MLKTLTLVRRQCVVLGLFTMERLADWGVTVPNNGVTATQQDEYQL